MFEFIYLFIYLFFTFLEFLHTVLKLFTIFQYQCKFYKCTDGIIKNEIKLEGKKLETLNSFKYFATNESDDNLISLFFKLKNISGLNF